MEKTDERKRFEAWYAPIYCCGEIANMPIRPANGEYRSAQQEIAWEAWQASANSAVAAFLEQTGQYVTNDQSRQACIAEAITADREARPNAKVTGTGEGE